MARFRGAPSGNVVVISARAVGAIIAPPTPWAALATSSQASDVAKPPNSDARENSSRPAMKIFLRPSRSPDRPPTPFRAYGPTAAALAGFTALWDKGNSQQRPAQAAGVLVADGNLSLFRYWPARCSGSEGHTGLRRSA